METTELIEILSRLEDSKHQFKLNVHNGDSLAAELVAFSNSGGGRMFIGVSDQGEVVGLSQEDVARINQLISNASSQNVRPPINPVTENVRHSLGIVMVVTVFPGIAKPYMDKDGAIWVKSGSDKRRATSRGELQRMFQEAGLVHADETPVEGLGIADLDLPYFQEYYSKQYGGKLDEATASLSKVLENLNLTRGAFLNLAGALFFAKTPQYHLPSFVVKAVAFHGTGIEETAYLDSREISGKLSDICQQTVSFLMSNTRRIQGDQGFNSEGEPEVPRDVWEELVVNALVHRDYFVLAPVRVLIFSDRIEIISPGHLPNNLTVENIKAGNSNSRNPILTSYAAKLLPYRGLGSGILRSLKLYPSIEFVDDREGNLFKVIVSRNDQST